jgi:hypothetical protein
MSDFIRADMFILNEKQLLDKGFKIQTLKKEIVSINITNSTLKKLEDDYSHFIINLNQKINKL